MRQRRRGRSNEAVDLSRGKGVRPGHWAMLPATSISMVARSIAAGAAVIVPRFERTAREADCEAASVRTGEEKRLMPGASRAGKKAYLHPQARVPRTIDARGFVTAFDSLVWERSRMERIFGMNTRSNVRARAKTGLRLLRVPVPLALPLSAGATSSRQGSQNPDRTKRVSEPPQWPPRRPRSGGELRRMQAWLELDRVEVGDRGDLAPMLRGSVGHGAAIM